MSKRFLSIIVNPKAGRGKRESILPQVKKQLKDTDLPCEYIVSQSTNHAKNIAEKSAEIGNTIVACGGDGHVGALANIASRHKVDFGIIPTGAGNDFAADLGIDTNNIELIVSALVNRNCQSLDLGTINEKSFCGVAGVGFSSNANEWANQQSWISGTPLYIASVLRTLVAYQPQSLSVIVDNKRIETSAWLVAVANARSFGGGMCIAPKASLVDGLLDVVIVGSVSRLEFLKTFPKVFTGNHITHPAIKMLRGKKILIEQSLPEPSLPMYADGECIATLPVSLSVLEGSLNQLLPPKNQAY